VGSKAHTKTSVAAIELSAELEITSRVDEVAQVRRFVRKLCRSLPDGCLHRERISQIELAVTEVVTNVIRHAYEGASDRTIYIAGQVRNGVLSLTFYDRGKRFDPASVPPPCFDGSKSGGFGVYIISQIADEIDYSRDETGRNRTCLKIRLADVQTASRNG